MKLAFARWIERQIEKDSRTVLLTGDLGFRAFENIQARFPKNFINVGVSEQNMIGLAAGLAIAGMKPYAYSIAPFLILRAYEQIRNDICFYNLDVKLVGNGGGLGYGIQGSSHHTLEDVAVMSALPNMRCLLPAASADVDAALAQARGPTYVRLTHEFRVPAFTKAAGAFAGVRGLTHGEEKTVVALGSLAPRAWEALRDFPQIGVFAVSELPFLSAPQALLAHIRRSGHCVVLEEHGAHGGLAAQLATLLMKQRIYARFEVRNVPAYQDENLDEYFPLMDKLGFSVEALQEFVLGPTATRTKNPRGSSSEALA